MNVIVVKTQAELDALPDSFEIYTRIEIRGGVPGDRIFIKKARGNSFVEARGNSFVEAWGNSSVEAYEFAMIAVLAATVILKRLCDHVMVSLRGVNPKILKKDKTVTVKKTPQYLNISFEKWLDRGWVSADGIHQKLVSKKKKGSLEVFTVQDWKKKQSYVVKRGENFSHGETVEKAIESLRYKLSDRDTSRFKKWTLATRVSESDAIQAYMAITGACEFGVRSFVESAKVPKGLTVKKVIELTRGQYGANQFAAFFN